MEVPRKGRGSAMEVPWKCRGNVTEMPWKCHGSATEVSWKCHGSGTEVSWKCHGSFVEVSCIWASLVNFLGRTLFRMLLLSHAFGLCPLYQGIHSVTLLMTRLFADALHARLLEPEDVYLPFGPRTWKGSVSPVVSTTFLLVFSYWSRSLRQGRVQWATVGVA